MWRSSGPKSDTLTQLTEHEQEVLLTMEQYAVIEACKVAKPDSRLKSKLDKPDEYKPLLTTDKVDSCPKATKPKTGRKTGTSRQLRTPPSQTAARKRAAAAVVQATGQADAQAAATAAAAAAQAAEEATAAKKAEEAAAEEAAAAKKAEDAAEEEAAAAAAAATAAAEAAAVAEAAAETATAAAAPDGKSRQTAFPSAKAARDAGFQPGARVWHKSGKHMRQILQ